MEKLFNPVFFEIKEDFGWYTISQMYTKDLHDNHYMFKTEFIHFSFYFLDQLHINADYEGAEGTSFYEYKGERLNKDVGPTIDYFAVNDFSKMLLAYLQFAKKQPLSFEMKLYSFYEGLLREYRKGYQSFQSEITRYIKPFIPTNENIKTVLKKLISDNSLPTGEKIIQKFSKNAIYELQAYFGFDIYSYAFNEGVKFASYSFIANRIDFLPLNEFDLLNKGVRKAMGNKSIKEYWHGDTREFDELCKILNEKRIISISGDVKIWQRSGTEFAAFILALSKAKKFEYLQVGKEDLIFKVCSNTFKLNFKKDTLKKARIPQSTITKVKNYFDIINECVSQFSQNKKMKKVKY